MKAAGQLTFRLTFASRCIFSSSVTARGGLVANRSCNGTDALISLLSRLAASHTETFDVEDVDDDRL
jgi:hypothetical protein